MRPKFNVIMTDGKRSRILAHNISNRLADRYCKEFKRLTLPENARVEKREIPLHQSMKNISAHKVRFA